MITADDNPFKGSGSQSVNIGGNAVSSSSQRSWIELLIMLAAGGM